MAAIITEKFRIHNAKQFKEDFSAAEASSSTYIFIGRPYDWATEPLAPAPANAVGEEIDSYSDMIALKQVAAADVSHGLTRYDWTSGVTYDEYSHNYSATNLTPATSKNNLYDGRFYVMTDEYHVYKCLRTGRATGGAIVASTVKPSGTSATAIVATSDTGATMYGYLWKYITTVTASETIKFVTNDFIPVKTMGVQTEIDGVAALGATVADDGTSQWDVENSAVDGGVHHAVVTAGGTGYTNGDGSYESIPIDGDGTGGVATVHVISNAISHVTITTAGTGYRRATINVADIPGGTGGAITVIISPLIGHGADPIQELGGNYIIVNSRLEFGEGDGDFPIDNDFRRIGLLQDPFNKGTTTVSTAATMAAYHQLTLTNASALNVDDIIKNATSDGTGIAVSRVVSKTGNVVSHIPVANSDGGYVNFTTSHTVYVGGTTISPVTAVNAAFPEVERYTGQVLYVENRGAVTRAADQIEDIKLIIEM